MEREPEKRIDPELIFPGAQSMIVVALNYFTPHEHEEDDAKGKVSRYAWGDDYHDVFKEKLSELLGFYQIGKRRSRRENLRRHRAGDGQSVGGSRRFGLARQTFEFDYQRIRLVGFYRRDFIEFGT